MKELPGKRRGLVNGNIFQSTAMAVFRRDSLSDKFSKIFLSDRRQDKYNSQLRVSLEQINQLVKNTSGKKEKIPERIIIGDTDKKSGH